MTEIRYVERNDREFWFRLDRHLPAAEFDRKVRDRQGYVQLENARPVGLLRYNLFWDNTPFCTMLYVEQECRGRGYGSQLMRHWEMDMQSRGYDLLLVSTQADEDAQHVYRKLGYRDCGGFVLEHQPMELLLMKRIRETTGCPDCGEAARE